MHDRVEIITSAPVVVASSHLVEVVFGARLYIAEIDLNVIVSVSLKEKRTLKYKSAKKEKRREKLKKEPLPLLCSWKKLFLF